MTNWWIDKSGFDQRIWICRFAIMVALLRGGLSYGEDSEAFFEGRVRPILAERCWECHGSKKQESGLRLDSPDAIRRGGDSRTALLDSNTPEASALLLAIRHQGELKMPPEQMLSDDQINTLTDWVQRGLPWSKGAIEATSKSISERVSEARRDHWAFQPIARPNLPTVTRPEWARTLVDYHILQALDQSSLTPSNTASPFQLYRRLSFDLLGLPPTAEELAEFEAHDVPDRYERLVDRCLASPRYGERWGRHWLDLARYADTKGYAFDKDRRYPFSYTYRDYVVNSLNADLGLDEFLRQQIAADLLPTDAERRSLAALGFLTTGRKFNNAHDDIDDKIDLICRGLMGLTVACARCHDHKYDAVAMEDYYSLYGVFASCHEPSELPLIGSQPESAEYQQYQQELAGLQQKLEQFYSDQHLAITQEAREKAGDYLTKIQTQLPDEELSQFVFYRSGKAPLRRSLVERWQSYLKKHESLDDPVWGIWNELGAISDSDANSRFTEQARAILSRRAASSAIQPLNPLVRDAFTTADHPILRVDLARVYGQLLHSVWQSWVNLGANQEAQDKLAPAEQQLLAVLVGPESAVEFSRDEIKRLLNRAEKGKQAEITKQIDALQATSPGAAPRAMVVAENTEPHDPHVFIRGNASRQGKQVPRQFLELLAGPDRRPFQFGSGRLELANAIVASANPLTRRVLVNRIWMHHFVEPLVLTPGDFGVRCERPVHAELLDHMADSLADRHWSMKQLHRQLVLSSTYQQSSAERVEPLAVDGENRRFWRMNRRRLEFEALRDSILVVSGQLQLSLGGRPVELTKPPFATRRSIYGYIDRQDLPNLFRVFDVASPDQSNERRPRTTVPQQALYLMNSPFVWEQIREVAREVQSPDAQAGIERLYLKALGRLPQTEEMVLALQFMAGNPTSESVWQDLAQTLLETNEFAFVD